MSTLIKVCLSSVAWLFSTFTADVDGSNQDTKQPTLWTMAVWSQWDSLTQFLVSSEADLGSELQSAVVRWDRHALRSELTGGNEVGFLRCQVGQCVCVLTCFVFRWLSHMLCLCLSQSCSAVKSSLEVRQRHVFLFLTTVLLYFEGHSKINKHNKYKHQTPIIIVHKQNW